MARRDRHDRGLRGPLLPAQVPGHSTRSDAFADAVRLGAERLERRWGERWGRVEFGIETVPPSDPAPWEHGVALGRLFPSDAGEPARIVLYRRPLEMRAEVVPVEALIRDVLAEHIAHVLGRTPEEIDPDYGLGT